MYTFDIPNAYKGCRYYDPANNSYSCIDHFPFSTGLCDMTSCIHRCILSPTPSKHMPVLMDMNMESIHRYMVEDCSVKKAKATTLYRVQENDEERYRKTLDWTLPGIVTPDVSECINVNCDNEEHGHYSTLSNVGCNW